MRAKDPEAWKASARERTAKYRERHPSAGVESTKRYHINNPTKRAEAQRRRRARVREVLTVPYNDLDIFERDGWTCQLCGSVIDRTLTRTDRMGPNIDHIVPILHGGPDTPDNVQAAHRSCNSRKGARAA
jgi:5-methylcytosine-specific restriction endonuclease McrA